MSKIVLTGGTGLIGSHVAEYFAHRNCDVTALVRKNSDTSFLDQLGLKTVIGDICDPKSLKDAFEGASFVIHTAGKVTDWGTREQFQTVNVQGTRNVLVAAMAAGISDVIVTGSCSSYGEENCRSLKNENSPFNAKYPYWAEAIFPCGMNHYRESKADATRESILFAEKNGMNVTILEPVFVFGEREFHSGFYEYLMEAKKRTPVLPGHPNNLFHVIYGGDVALAYYAAWEKKLKGANRFLIGNKNVDTMDSIFSLFCQNAGLKKPASIPKWMIYPVGLVMELASTFSHSKHPPTLTRGRVNMFYDSICYDVSHATQTLGFEQQTPLDKAIENTVQWYRDNGHL